MTGLINKRKHPMSGKLAAGSDDNEMVGTPAAMILDAQVHPIAGKTARQRPPCTERGNAQRLVNDFGNNIRYCPEGRYWLIWRENRWVRDEDGEVERMAKKTARNILKEAEQEVEKLRAELIRWSLTSESAHHLHAMVELAKTEEGIPVHTSRLDADPMVLGVANGVVDLRNGRLRPARRDDYITKSGLVAYDASADCPKWKRFINEVFASSDEMVKYIQRVVGYWLTGLTIEQLMFVLWGVGANGKSVLVETVKELGGDYARVISPEMLMVRKPNGGATPDLARLRGARMALASESDEGAILAAGFVKNITGQDTISCRELYGSPFEFRPAFKLLLTTNHKPTIKDDGIGIWRRIQLIPFTMRFEGERRNPKLREELLAELPGILNWAIEGCLEWQKKGLDPPEAITKAVKDYRTDMDVIGEWIGECCEVVPGSVELFTDLYVSYSDWAKSNCERPMSRKAFAMKLDERGFLKDKEGSRDKRRVGLGLK